MRLFFALVPDPGAATAIGAWRDRHLPGQSRPVPLGNLHITLAFLGEVGEFRLERLCESVDGLSTAPGPAPLSLHIDQLGYWPKPGVCWIGPREWPHSLEDLARRLGEVGVEHGCKRQRGRYTPHITLLRGCRAPPPAPLQPPAFELSFDSFCLFQSRQGKRGVHYEPLADWAL